MTWEDAKERVDRGDVVILPLGATEQHGQHLPIGTDSFAAIDLAEAAAQETDSVVAPPVWCGMSAHHMVLPGTISIRPEVLLEYVYDMISSLAQHGFHRFVLLNGHRVANLPWIQLVGERVHRQLDDCRVVIFDPAYMSMEIIGELGFGPLGHAEEIETSHMLAAKPDLVRMEKAKNHEREEVPFRPADLRDNRDRLCYVPTPTAAAKKLAITSGGTSGRATMADISKGKRYREHLVKRLVQVIEQMHG